MSQAGIISVAASSGGTPVVKLTPQAHTAPGTSPVVADASGNINVNGTVVAAHSIPIRTDSLAANTVNVEVQYAAAVASTDATKVGFASFNSANFTVDANGFVSASGSSGISTIDGDNGTSVTGSTVKIYALPQAGSSVSFIPTSATDMALNMTDTNNNTIIGSLGGNASITGHFNTGIGRSVFNLLSSGANNIGLGFNSLSKLTTGTVNLAIGNAAGVNYTSSESSNICLQNLGTVSESHVMRLGTTGSSNGQVNKAFIAGINGVTVSNQLMVVMNSSTEQLGTAAIPATGIVTINGDSGSITGSTVTFEAANSGNDGTATFTGSSTTMSLNFSDANNNICMGVLAGNVGGDSGSFNSGYGYASLNGISGGSYNSCFGQISGENYVGNESSNVLLANAGVVGESNVMRLGSSGSGNGQVNNCYVAGVNGVTVTGTAVLCATNGQLGTVVSSIRYKENVEDISSDVSVLALRPVEFNFISDKSKTKQYGLIAEEVEKDFPYLCFYNAAGQPDSVKYHELPVLLLKEIQRLNDRIQKLESKMA